MDFLFCKLHPQKHTGGFTLIELSIVLVIIGLVAGGVLFGKELVEGAKVRKQIAQIEEITTAAHTFQQKYGCLPGDCVRAATFGLPARGNYTGGGDGDGLIISPQCASAAYSPLPRYQYIGEAPMFWRDLGTVRLIEGNFNRATASTNGANANVSGDELKEYFPQGKIDQTFVYVWSTRNNNYFSLSKITQLLSCSNGGWFANAPNPPHGNNGLSIAQAYAIDSKVDDGMPVIGKVIAYAHLYGNPGWSGINTGSAPTNIINQVPSATSCFDNSKGTNENQRYSLDQNSNSVNCSLSFRW